MYYQSQYFEAEILFTCITAQFIFSSFHPRWGVEWEGDKGFAVLRAAVDKYQERTRDWEAN